MHDLLPAAIFARQAAQLRNHRRQQLHHDRRADVGHDAERKDRAVLQRAAAEQIEERGDTAALLFGERSAKPFLQNGLVDARRRDRGAETDDDDDRERKQNPPPQLRNFDRV